MGCEYVYYLSTARAKKIRGITSKSIKSTELNQKNVVKAGKRNEKQMRQIENWKDGRFKLNQVREDHFISYISTLDISTLI